MAPESSSMDLWQSLCAPTKLTRDKGLKKAADLKLDLCQSLDFLKVSPMFAREDVDGSTEWPVKLGFLLAVDALLNQQPYKCVGQAGDEVHRYVHGVVLPTCLRLLEDESECRVCLGAASALMGVANCVGVSVVFEQSVESVTRMIRDNLDYEEIDLYGSNSSLVSNTSSTASEVLGSTSGRKYIESALKLTQALLLLASREEGFESVQEFKLRFVNSGLVGQLHQSVKHSNRFVREGTFDVMTAFINLNNSLEKNSADNKDMIEDVARGLADNWSQVRMAASKAARQLLMNLSEEDFNAFDIEKSPTKVLLPRVCLNRYYVAEGVKLYNQTTWQLVLRNQGQLVVQKMIKEFVEYYVEGTEAENHAVREAACLCISELTMKMESSVLRQHLSALMAALLTCFEDESWPVRDTACVACGNVVKMFPNECMEYQPQLMALFKTNLCDPIASVREGGAVALSHCLLVWRESVFKELSNLIHNSLENIREQPTEHLKDSSSEEKSSMTKGSDRFENQQMYSCGSLAPKIRRKAHAGCSNAAFKKPSEPWEAADGAVHLLAEAFKVLKTSNASVQHQGDSKEQGQSLLGRPLGPGLAPSPKIVALADRHLPVLASACQVRHYPMHISFIATVLKRLPGIGEALGKRHFKLYLESFLEPVFYAGKSDNNLARDASQCCLQALAKLLGPSILQGRVMQMQPPRPQEDLQVLHLALGPQAQLLA